MRLGIRTDEINDEAAVGGPPGGTMEESLSIRQHGGVRISVGWSEMDCVAGIGKRISEADDGFEAR